MEELVNELMEEYDLMPDQCEQLIIFADCMDGMDISLEDCWSILIAAIETLMDLN